MRRASMVLLAALVGTTLGCSALPESGPVHRGSVTPTVASADSARFDAPGPGRGDSQVEIVNGFLTAMTANPSATSVARSFLSTAARAAWNPTRATTVYQVSSVDEQAGFQVQVRLADPRRLDSRGGWLGSAPAAQSRLELRMVRERGQWRIADPPDELLIPNWFLEQEYQPYDLYFFDQTERVLVPDRVYVPRGEQTASQLVRALLSGPGSDVAGVTRTEFAPQTQLDLSVLVSPDGIAEVPLSDQLLRLSPAKLSRAVAQLSWTLRQVPGINRLRITVDDAPVPLPDGRRDFSVQEGDAFAPRVSQSVPLLYGLRKGRLVSVLDDKETPVDGAFGRPGYALRSFGVRLDGSRAAAVADDGRSVFSAPLEGDAAGLLAPAKRVYDGRNVLRPAFDMFGGLWLVDLVRGRAKVVDVVGGRPVTIDVPGISGRRINAFVVSRDGTRMAAIVDRGALGDQVVTADLLRSGDGTIARATAGITLESLPSDLTELRDLAWRSPNDLAVLGGPAKGVAQVVYASLDDSPGDPGAVPPDSWPGATTALVGSPDTTLPFYLETQSGQLLRLDDSSRWRTSGITNGLLSPTYVG